MRNRRWGEERAEGYGKSEWEDNKEEAVGKMIGTNCLVDILEKPKKIIIVSTRM